MKHISIVLLLVLTLLLAGTSFGQEWTLVAPVDSVMVGNNDTVYFAWRWSQFYDRISPLFIVTLMHNGISEQYFSLYNEGGVYECAYIKLEMETVYSFNISALEYGFRDDAFMVSKSPTWSFKTTSVSESKGQSLKPGVLTLCQNYPNPFNPTTTIAYDLPATSHVRLTVFNAAGQIMTTLVDGEQEAGSHRATWDGSAVPSGVYFYRLEAGGFAQIKKMTLMK